MTAEMVETFASLINRIEALEADVKKLRKKPPAKRFVKPSEYELECYFHEQGSNTCLDDAKAFMDHYEGCGWKAGKNAMKCWKASVRNWIRGSRNGQGTRKGNTQSTNGLDLDAIDY